MAEIEQKPAVIKKLTKKQAKKEVFDKLSGALAEYSKKMDKKKFETKLKKASKLFAVDIAKAFNKDRFTNSAKKKSAKQ